MKKIIILLLFLISSYLTSYTQTLTRPVADFSADTLRGCVDLCVKFTDKSQVPTGRTLVRWRWVFGDGDTSAVQHPTHCYKYPGNFTVTLQVKDSKGTWSEITYKFSYIKISSHAIVNFTIPEQLCKLSTPLTITNNTTPTTGLSYKWDFGDGSFSTVKAPSKAYTATGNYNIKLKVVNTTTNCPDSLIKPIKVFNVVADFDIEIKQGFTRECVDSTITFRSKSVGANPLGYFWTLGEAGAPSTGEVVEYAYTTPGTKTAIHFIQGGDNNSCNDVAVKPVVIDRPVVNFSFTPDWICGYCSPPVTFTDMSTAVGTITHWEWTVYDVAYCGDTIPCVKYTTKNPQHSFCSEPHRDVTLNVRTQEGCWGIAQTKTITNLNTELEIDEGLQLAAAPKRYRGACVPILDTLKIDTARIIYAIDTLLWRIDSVSCEDNSIHRNKYRVKQSGLYNSFSILPNNTLFEFPRFGTYRITLLAHDINCAWDSSKYVEVKIGDTVKPNFYMQNILVKDQVACITSPVLFNDSISGGTDRNKCKSDWRWHWYFGDCPSWDANCSLKANDTTNSTAFSTNIVSSRERDPIHSFYNDTLYNGEWQVLFRPPGLDTIYFFAVHNGCTSTVVRKVLDLKGPVGVIDSIVQDRTPIPTKNPYLYEFYGKVYGANSAGWKFGDGTPNFDTTYAGYRDSAGVVTLHLYEPTICDSIYSPLRCSGNFFKNPYKEITLYSYATNAYGSCSHTNVLNRFVGTQKRPAELHVHDYVKPDFIPGIFDALGHFIPEKKVCWDKYINFNFDTCQYVAQTEWFIIHPLQGSASFGTKGYTYHPQNYVLRNPLPSNVVSFKLDDFLFNGKVLPRGVFDVAIRGTSFTFRRMGQTGPNPRYHNIIVDSLKKDIKIYKPYAHPQVDDVLACLDQNIQFSPVSNAGIIPDTTYVSFLYDMGNGNTIAKDTNEPFTYSYNTRGYYYPKLIITDALGCVATDTLRNPAGDSGKVQMIVVTRPEANFIINDAYLCQKQSQLVFSTGISGFDTTNYLETSRHYWGYDLNQDRNEYYDPVYQEILLPDDPKFDTANKVLGIHYSWDFGDGTPVDTHMLPVHSYQITQQDIPITLTVSYTKVGNCSHSITQKFDINPKPQPGFYSDKTILNCYPTSPPASFVDTSKSDDEIVYWEWDPGDGSGNVYGKTPSKTYFEPGVYDVRLITQTVNRCRDTLLKQGFITVTGPSAFSIGPVDPTRCLQDTLKLRVQKPKDINFIRWYVDNTIDFVPYNDSVSFSRNPADTNDFFLSFKYDTAGTHKWFVYFTDTSNCKIYYPHDNPKGSQFWPPTLGEVLVHAMKADFWLTDSACGVGDTIHLLDRSDSPQTWLWHIWDAGNMTEMSGKPDITFAFNNLGGPNLVRLIITRSYPNYFDTDNCKDTANKVITVHQAPTFSAWANRYLICPTDTTLMTASYDSHFLYSWQPAAAIKGTNTSRSVQANPSSPTTYIATIQVDTSTCTRDTMLFINTQKSVEFKFGYRDGNGTLWYVDDCIDDPVCKEECENDDSCKLFLMLPLGDTVVPFVKLVPDEKMKIDTIIWIDAIRDAQGRIVLSPQDNSLYKVAVYDTLGCSPTVKSLRILVQAGTLAMPRAFTPNGDGINDYIMVRGWGMKRLINFQVFNRWGQLLYETDDINQGWDGYYNGKLQNMDTYTYNATVETLDGKILKKTGSFVLIR